MPIEVELLSVTSTVFSLYLYIYIYIYIYIYAYLGFALLCTTSDNDFNFYCGHNNFVVFFFFKR